MVVMAYENTQRHWSIGGIFIRIFHTVLALVVTATLLWKNTILHRAFVEGEGLVYGILYLVLLLISICLYYTTCLTDPGYVNIAQYQKRLESQAFVQEVDGDHYDDDIEMTAATSAQPLNKRTLCKYRFCDYCEIQAPLRSKHCEECKLCVRRYDHHCPWLDTCIGERNHKYFWLFLLFTAVVILWTFEIVWESFISKETWTNWFHANLVLFFDIVVLVLSGPVVIGLLVFHTYLMISGLSTWEAASRERITYLKYLKEDCNPFDDGCCRNIYSFFCVFQIKRWETIYVKNAQFKDDIS